MSQPDEIRNFVLNHYVLPARERGEDSITLSAHSIQQAIGSEVAEEKICKALDTRLFLDQAIVTLIRREGSPQAADAQWTFGVSMHGQRGEVLVAVLKRKRDLAILKEEGWYRIPVDTAPRRWPPKWIAFYQGAQWGHKRGVNYYAPVKQIRHALRRDLFPDEFSSQKSSKTYFQIVLGSLQRLDPPIASRRRRVIIFIPTTWQKFATAVEINDLYDDSLLEDLLWTELKKLEIPVERQWRVEVKKKYYYLDFALFCRKGKVAIEADGDRWHLGRPHSTADNVRQNDLASTGWNVLRFDTHQIREQMASYCIPKVQETIDEFKGLADEGLAPRKFYTAADGSTVQQLTLFEAKAEYDLD